MQQNEPRRRFLRQLFTGLSGVLLAACEALSRTKWFPEVLGTAEQLSSGAQHLLIESAERSGRARPFSLRGSAGRRTQRPAETFRISPPCRRKTGFPLCRPSR